MFALGVGWGMEVSCTGWGQQTAAIPVHLPGGCLSGFFPQPCLPASWRGANGVPLPHGLFPACWLRSWAGAGPGPHSMGALFPPAFPAPASWQLQLGAMLGTGAGGVGNRAPTLCRPNPAPSKTQAGPWGSMQQGDSIPFPHHTPPVPRVVKSQPGQPWAAAPDCSCQEAQAGGMGNRIYQPYGSGPAPPKTQVSKLTGGGGRCGGKEQGHAAGGFHSPSPQPHDSYSQEHFLYTYCAINVTSVPSQSFPSDW